MELAKLHKNLRAAEKNLRRSETLEKYWSKRYQVIRNSKKAEIVDTLGVLLLLTSFFMGLSYFLIDKNLFYYFMISIAAFSFFFIIKSFCYLFIKIYCFYKKERASSNSKRLLLIKEIRMKSINEFIMGAAIVRFLEKREYNDEENEELKTLAKASCYQIVKESEI